MAVAVLLVVEVLSDVGDRKRGRERRGSRAAGEETSQGAVEVLK